MFADLSGFTALAEKLGWCCIANIFCSLLDDLENLRILSPLGNAYDRWVASFLSLPLHAPIFCPFDATTRDS